MYVNVVHTLTSDLKSPHTHCYCRAIQPVPLSQHGASPPYGNRTRPSGDAGAFSRPLCLILQNWANWMHDREEKQNMRLRILSWELGKLVCSIHVCWACFLLFKINVHFWTFTKKISPKYIWTKSITISYYNIDSHTTTTTFIIKFGKHPIFLV